LGNKGLNAGSKNGMFDKCAELNPNWTGDKVKRTGLHKWIRSHFYKPMLCQMCLSKPPYDLANKTGIYNRDFKNWRYYCRKCHMITDGRLFNINEYNRTKGSRKYGR
jgi:hypothetical protein